MCGVGIAEFPSRRGVCLPICWKVLRPFGLIVGTQCGRRWEDKASAGCVCSLGARGPVFYGPVPFPRPMSGCAFGR